VTDELEQRLSGYVGRRLERIGRAPDAVNAAMIRHYVDVLGDENPVYVDAEAARHTGRAGPIAPPAMLQVWTMPGYGPTVADTRYDRLWSELRAVLTEAGYPAIVATNSDHEYLREVGLGERLHHVETIESISAEKATGLGRGFFITTVLDYADERGSPVGQARFRVLVYRPAGGDASARPVPPEGRDYEFWFDGARQGRLLVQRCSECGQIRHPPSPACPACQSLTWDAHESGGRGSIYSFVIVHHPQAPGFEYPLPVVLVELDEGFRVVAGVAGVAPEDVSIGDRVDVEFFSPSPGMTLPRFRPVPGSVR
jgi:uncharacterized OB-fold protein